MKGLQGCWCDGQSVFVNSIDLLKDGLPLFLIEINARLRLRCAYSWVFDLVWLSSVFTGIPSTINIQST